jgi:hypothetical protein
VCFVLDPGGSREIGSCPHLRIYPITKLATPLGRPDCVLVSLVSLALIACFLVSESVGDPSRLSGFESSLKIFVLFPNFVFTYILALYPLVACKNHLSSHPNV